MTLRKLIDVSCGLYFSVCAALAARAADSSSYQEWQFETALNPAQPTVTTNTAGVATATVVPGLAAAGWLPDLTGFGSQTGVWDLGFQNPDDPTNVPGGQILLNIPDPAAATASDHTELDLRLVQFVDGAIYKGDLKFSLTGATFVGRTIVEASLPGQLPGNWVEDHFHWRLEPSQATVSLTITGAANGTVLDKIRVDTAGAVPPPLVITSIQRSPQGLAISWSGGLPPYQVFVSTNLDGASWQAVGPSLSGTSADVTLSGPVGFIKVEASD